MTGTAAALARSRRLVLPEIVGRGARAHPDRPALVFGEAVRTHAELQDRAARLAGVLGSAEELHENPEKQARLLTGDGADAMAKVRGACDALEEVVSDELWPLPKYREMLFPV